MPPLTPSQTIGPFFHVLMASPGPVRLAPDDAEAVRLHGRVLDGEGDPVDDALVEAWDGSSARFARCPTGVSGEFAFDVTAPSSPDAPPYLALSLFARGLLGGLTTRCYLSDPGGGDGRADAAWQAVPIERRPTLVAQPNGDGYRFDLRLQGEHETVWFCF